MTNANLHHQLIAAIRSGNLAEMAAALDAGAAPDQVDEHGVAGLPLRIACYNGHVEQIRELVRRGADPNPHRANPAAGDLIALAVAGEQKEAVRVLLELGAELPAGVKTGLSLSEILAAQGVANRRKAHRDTPIARSSAPPVLEEVQAPLLDEATRAALPEWMAEAGAEVEEIQMKGCYGVDTNVLNAELAQASASKPEADGHLGAPTLEFGKRKFWKKGG